MKDRVPNYDELRFLEDPKNPGRNRGYCFLRFDNPILAREAYDNLNKNIVIDGTCITVDWADDFSDQDVNKVQIHLSGINENIPTENLYSVFGQFGQIINIKLARDLLGKDRKDYGFITYSNEAEAEKAVKEFNWKQHFDTKINVQFARKMTSILKHKQKVQGDMLERKRRRDNIINNQKIYKNSYSDDEENENNSNQTEQNNNLILNQFSSMINNIKTGNNNSNNNVNEMMIQMMSNIYF